MRRRRPRSWRVRLLCSAVVAMLLLTTAYGAVHQNSPNPGAHTSRTVAGVSFTAEKSLYTATQKPTLILRFQHGSTARVGFLTTLFDMPNVYALSSPSVQVKYNGSEVNIPTDITAQSGNFLVTLDPGDILKPGTYTVQASGETTDGQRFSQTANFAWGVLAVNTSQSIYLPGETALLQMGVLDSDGHTICGAPLKLTITDPSGNRQDVPYQDSTDCHGDSFSSTPDYSASYMTKGIGRYKVTLAILNNPNYSINDYFEVRTSVPFIVARNSVTRIYPIHTYGMGIHVTANQDFVGTATETISSARFVIPDHPGAIVSTQNGETTLSWPVNWKQGSSYDLSYQYLAPPVSPASYTVGPLKLTSTNGQVVFQEVRSWQVIADAAITLVKQTEVNVTTAATSNTSSVTSTAGDTLILLVAVSATGINEGVSSVTDSASNTWVYSSSAPSQNPPANFATATTSEIDMAYVAVASAITSITVNIGQPNAFSYDLLEFSDINTTTPVTFSASNDNETATLNHSTPSATVSTCDSPSTSQLMRNGDYFCTAPTSLVVGIINAGHQTGSPPFSLTTSGFTNTTPLTPASLSDEAQGAYGIVTTSGSYSINWTTTASKKDATGIMAFQQNGNTNGGDQQNFFWSH
jgi:hypothetical protein